jgi:hypothetical protein
VTITVYVLGHELLSVTVHRPGAQAALEAAERIPEGFGFHGGAFLEAERAEPHPTTDEI